MQKSHFLSLMSVLACLLARNVLAESGVPRSPASLAMTERVDELIAQQWRIEGIEPTGLVSDAEFLRRAYLDLTGRIPRVSEARAFLNNEAANRRATLIDELLERPTHATHLANTWSRFLLPEANAVQRIGNGQAFNNWLFDRFSNNDSYDGMVVDLLMATGQVNQNGPVLFYSALQAKPEELAASTSRAFLGVQIQCAQCHDHPFDHWTQKDFWGFAAFFAQLTKPQGQQQIVAAIEDLSEGEVTLPETDVIVPPRYLKGEIAELTSTERTRRQLLAQWLTDPDNPYFARAAVNRVWSLLFGRGIVEPVDDLGEHNHPSHPQLLDELSEYFVQGGFDLRDLFSTLANTRAYQLSSASAANADPVPHFFERMAIKKLTAEQLYDSLQDAIIRRDSQNMAAYGGINRGFDQNRQAFITKFNAPASSATEYEAGIPQALTLMNGTQVLAATDLNQSDILVAIQFPFFNDAQRVETLFLASLSRKPNDVERAAFVEYVTSKKTNAEKKAALSDVLWALLNSAEFTLNH